MRQLRTLRIFFWQGYCQNQEYQNLVMAATVLALVVQKKRTCRLTWVLGCENSSHLASVCRGPVSLR
jgi:hypothetical protein